MNKIEQIKTILIENEPDGLDVLRREVSKFDFIEIIGEAADSSAASYAIEKLKPQLIISDIRLSDENDTIFKVLDRLQERGVGLPYVILVTGHEDYYEVAINHTSTIVGFIMKTVSAEKLKVALFNVQKLISKSHIPVNKRIFSLDDHVYIKYRGGGNRQPGEWFVPINQIKCIISEDATVKIIFEEKVKKTTTKRNDDGTAKKLEYFEVIDEVARLGFGLGKVYKRLDPKYFVQINPGTIINVRYIENVKLAEGALEIKIWGVTNWFYLTGDDRISNFKSYFQFTQ